MESEVGWGYTYWVESEVGWGNTYWVESQVGWGNTYCVELGVICRGQSHVVESVTGSELSHRGVGHGTESQVGGQGNVRVV